MKKYLIQYLSILIILVSSCKKEQESDAQSLRIFEKTAGYYKIISAVAESPVDINLDGISNQDLLTEISYAEMSSISVVVTKNSKSIGFEWAEQSDNYEGTQATPYFHYSLKPAIYKFDFSAQTHRVSVIPNNDASDLKFQPPFDVYLTDDGTITCKFIKNVYTSQGYQDITVNAVYKKDLTYISEYF